MATYVGLKEFSEIIGCSKANITQCIKRNDSRIVYIRDDNGKILIDLEQSKAKWNLSRNIYTDKLIKKEKSSEKNIKKAEIEPLSENDNQKISSFIKSGSKKPVINETLDIETAKIHSLTADAVKKSFEYQILRGKLIERKYLELVLPNILSTLRARSELLPKRLSNAIANLIKNKYEVELPIEDLMIDMRNVLEKDIEDLLNYVVDENRKFFDNLRSS
ncbi:hypothetical protein [Brachyspira alvinipulli]|uniref:hypothetical protein n=1 Tax=Brachyspira alvinipulli TaxID=84379 RepID=UPI000481CF9C|nr:hypothetical protein [Brachyspira alvinipulli]